MAKSNRVRRFELHGETAETHKRGSKNFTPHDLVSFRPLNHPQKQFFESFTQNIPLIIQQGSAGTGKTAVALYAALSDVLSKETPYEKVVIVRSAVQARDIGFLPGSEEEKNEVYEAPYKQLCDELMEYKSNNYDNLKAKHQLEFHNSSFLRGTTIKEAVVIVDEVQNMTYHELRTIFTRCGDHTRIIFCGDTRQCDLHKKNDISGLEQFIRVVNNMDSGCFDIVNYRPEDIVRSGLVKEFLLAEEELVDTNGR